MFNFILHSIVITAIAISLHAETRIVSTAGAITETIYALGAEEHLVAVDMSSVYPEAATKLPQVGYARLLSAEGILSMRPTLVLLNSDAGPPEALAQLEEAGVRLLRLTNRHVPEAAIERILAIGEAIGKPKEAANLVTHLEEDLQKAKTRVTSFESHPKVLFIYTRGGGVMNVAGKGSGAESIIKLAGGTNAVQAYEGYKPLTAEGVITAAPDFILVTTRGLESSGGIDALLKQPGIAMTPAGKHRRIIAMDDLLLLGFGPRLGQAVMELSGKLHLSSFTSHGH